MSRYRFSLRFLICKIRIIIVPILQGYCESQMKKCMEAIGIVLQAILKVNSNFIALLSSLYYSIYKKHLNEYINIFK